MSEQQLLERLLSRFPHPSVLIPFKHVNANGTVVYLVIHGTDVQTITEEEYQVLCQHLGPTGYTKLVVLGEVSTETLRGVVRGMKITTLLAA